MSSWLDFAIDSEESNEEEFTQSPYATAFTMRPRNIVLTISRVSAPIASKMKQTRTISLINSEKMAMSQGFKISEFQRTIPN